jgi:hypothetical protein
VFELAVLIFEVVKSKAYPKVKYLANLNFAINAIASWFRQLIPKSKR